jgi:hypothetical protein
MTSHVTPLPSIKHIFSNIFKELKQNKQKEEKKCNNDFESINIQFPRKIIFLICLLLNSIMTYFQDSSQNTLIYSQLIHPTILTESSLKAFNHAENAILQDSIVQSNED